MIRSPTFYDSFVLHDKHDGHVYLRQQHTVEIIQLEEVPPPSTQSLFPSSPSSSAPSSSSSSSYVDLSTDGDSESVCTSYCSSIFAPEQPQTKEEESTALLDDTYSIRMSRIHAWRENFAKELGALCSGHTRSSHPNQQHPSHKERRDPPEGSDIAISLSGLQPQSRCHPSGTHHKPRISSFSLHSCPACDASFDTLQSLRRHGCEPRTNEACRVAVEYDFE